MIDGSQLAKLNNTLIGTKKNLREVLIDIGMGPEDFTELELLSVFQCTNCSIWERNKFQKVDWDKISPICRTCDTLNYTIY